MPEQAGGPAGLHRPGLARPLECPGLYGGANQRPHRLRQRAHPRGEGHHRLEPGPGDLPPGRRAPARQGHPHAAVGYGGAVFWDSGNEGSIVGSSFIGNSVDGYGGAIFWNITDSGNITDCLFENNVAYDGGALYFKGDNGVISGSNFTYNVAYYNGAVLMSSVQGSVVDCIFANNVATDSAGALGWSKKENGSIVGSKFVNNCASIGGAVFLNNGSDFLIT